MNGGDLNTVLFMHVLALPIEALLPHPPGVPAVRPLGPCRANHRQSSIEATQSSGTDILGEKLTFPSALPGAVGDSYGGQPTESWSGHLEAVRLPSLKLGPPRGVPGDKFSRDPPVSGHHQVQVVARASMLLVSRDHLHFISCRGRRRGGGGGGETGGRRGEGGGGGRGETGGRRGEGGGGGRGETRGGGGRERGEGRQGGGGEKGEGEGEGRQGGGGRWLRTHSMEGVIMHAFFPFTPANSQVFP